MGKQIGLLLGPIFFIFFVIKLNIKTVMTMESLVYFKQLKV